MKRLMSVIMFVAGCAGGAQGPRDECEPLDKKCEEQSMFHCAPDVAHARGGDLVYVWQELLVCEDDDVLGKGVCVETALPDGRNAADCDYVR